MVIAELDTMLKYGTARRAEGQCSSAIHLVPKDGGWRPCGYYLDLHARTIPDRYPVLLIEDYALYLSVCIIFTKIDLVRAYQQFPVHTDVIQKTAITTFF
jgi:hypothetical protein